MEKGLRTYLEARGLDPAAPEAEAQRFLANLGEDPKAALASKRQVISAALLLGVGIKERFLEECYGARVMETARPRRRMSLKGAIEAACIMDEKPQPGYGDGPQEWLSAGFSTVSLPGILGDSANKSLLFGYKSLAAIVPLVFGKRTVTSFQQYHEYRVTGDATFPEVAPGGEVHHGTLGEESADYQAKEHGLMFTITRQMIANDEAGAFLQIPQRFGRGAALTLEKAGAKLVLDNTDAFFHADNKNLSTGAGSAFGAAGLAAAEKLMLDQTDDAAGKNPVMIAPALLVVPNALKGSGDDLYKLALISGSDNKYKSMYEPRPWPFLGNTSFHASASDKKWYLFADPDDAPAFLVAYLNGIDTPIVEQMPAGASVLGTVFRATFDFGVAQGDPRGAVRSDGE